MRRKTAPLATLLWFAIVASILLLEHQPLMMAVASAEEASESSDAATTASSNEGCNNDNNNDQTCTDPSATKEAEEEEEVKSTTQQLSPSGERLISSTELASHGIKSTESKEAATAGGHTIWLSILGRVFDVTSGGPSYYGPKGSYNFYSGRDASPCFHSGKNNEEGAAAKLEEWEDDKHLMSVYDWSLFYEKHETYEFMGVLVNSKYYNENGEETEVRKDIVERASKAKVIVEKEREERKKARLEKRRAEREKNMKK